MVKSLMLAIAHASCVVCWSVASGVGLSLPAVAIDTDAVSSMIAQVTPSMSINRPTLGLGSQGVAVSELQAMLKLMGYYTGVVDGVYQESTASAVTQFQNAAGLDPDGIAGPATWSRLLPSSAVAGTSAPSSANPPANGFPVPSSLQTPPSNSSTAVNSRSAIATLPILKQGMRGPAVIQLQERLRALGFLSSAVDGVFGLETQSAVKAMQQRFKLEPDGIVGPATWNVLLQE